jgi:hypothetical protein
MRVSRRTSDFSHEHRDATTHRLTENSDFSITDSGRPSRDLQSGPGPGPGTKILLFTGTKILILPGPKFSSWSRYFFLSKVRLRILVFIIFL